MLRYAVLLPPQALARVHTVLADHGTIDVLVDVRALLLELVSPRDDCLVLDPALITPEIAETLASNIAEFPRAIVAYSSVTTAALESSVALAQRTPARFVFRGTPNERSALEQALFLTPDLSLGAELLFLLQRNMDRLTPALRERLTSMLRNGDGPSTPDALAAASAISRRTLDRALADAGFVSARRVLECVRVTTAFRAITTSNTPLWHVAMMLGYKAQRPLDVQISAFLGMTCSKLRNNPPSCTDAAAHIALQLTARDKNHQGEPWHVPRTVGEGPRRLKLVGDDATTRNSRRNASGDK